MAPDILRDSTIGLMINTLSKGRLLPFDDQRPGWEPPLHFLLPPKPPTPSSNSDDATPELKKPDSVQVEVAPAIPEEAPPTRRGSQDITVSTDSTGTPEPGSTKKPNSVVVEVVSGEEEKGFDPNLVTWYDDNDQDNPQNWSLSKRILVLVWISLLTFSIYIGSAIYTPSIPGVMKHFDVNLTTATLGLSLYVIGYGIGPIILSPTSELPSVGRTPVYMATLFVFAILQIPTIYAPNIHVLLAMRFWAGFVGSPALATGGASIQDIFPPMKLPYVFIVWSAGAVCGPVLGPVIGGFAAQNKNWRWPLFELLWISSFTWIVLMFWLPETHADTILLKRARRLRKLTGNMSIYSESEIKEAEMTGSQVVLEALWRPFQLMVEPAVLYCNIYLALAYAIFYLWFEAFPLVYTDMYHFNLGQSGLPFLGLIVTCILTSIGYICWNYFYVEPKFKETGVLTPESRVAVALVAAAFIPISLFMFGWTARASIPWIVPTIGAALYLPGLFLLFQSILVYLPMSYPKYAASVLAGNDLFRSSVAGAFPLFGRPMYLRLSIAGGCSLLAGLSIFFIPGLWFLYCELSCHLARLWPLSTRTLRLSWLTCFIKQQLRGFIYLYKVFEFTLHQLATSQRSSKP